MNFPDKYRFDPPAEQDFVRQNLAQLVALTGQLAQLSLPQQGAETTTQAETRQATLNLEQAYETLLTQKDPLAATDVLALNRVVRGLAGAEATFRDTATTGTADWIPPIPDRSRSIKRLTDILTAERSATERAMDLALYLSRWQLFSTGNYQTAFVAANGLMMVAGAGLLAIPAKRVHWYGVQLQQYQQSGRSLVLKQWLYGNAVWGQDRYRVVERPQRFIQNRYSPLNGPLDD